MALKILCLDDDPGVILSIETQLGSQSDYHLRTATTWEQAKLILETEPQDILLLDVNLGKGKKSGLDLLPEVKDICPGIDIIIVTGERDSDLFVRAIRSGAADYYQKPVQKDLLVSIQKLELKREKDLCCYALFNELTSGFSEANFTGRAPAFLDVIDKAKRLKGRDTSVLIQAETGTGKELLARFIHGLEENPQRPFIVINCATLNENLIESELFGHEKGAFTGAINKKIGKFHLANGGDVFLDEINSLRPDFQAKLLRVLQDKIIYPIGSRSPVSADFRVIAATNENLLKLVNEGRFREDLYHRLNVISLTLPPLRERKEDIPLLVDHFISKYDHRHKKKTITSIAMKHLMNYDWPGNVRELENLIHSMVVLSKSDVMDIESLPDHLINQGVHPAVLSSIKALELRFEKDEDLLSLPLEDFTKIMRKQYVQRAVKANKGNIKDTAMKLGMSRTTVYNLLNEGKHG